MKFKSLRFQRRGAVGVILLNRPAKRNALSDAMVEELDAGEVTDKGSINQRAVLGNRAVLVEKLHAEPPNPAVMMCAP